MVRGEGFCSNINFDQNSMFIFAITTKNCIKIGRLYSSGFAQVS